MKTEYAIINAAIGDTERDYDVYFKSSNPQEIINNLKANNYDPETTSIEDYTVDDDGEFYEGSNYDTIDNFIKRNEAACVKVWEQDIYVYINEDDITEYKTDDLYYEQAYQLDDGRWIAFDDAVNAWVMLG